MTQSSSPSQVRECATCFFTTRFPGVVIEEDGRCNFCKRDQLRGHLESHRVYDLDRLKEIAAELREKAPGKYHCIIGASGGLDSSYVLYVVRTVLDLNPLVVRYDSGLGHAHAVENLRRVCRSLGADLRVVRSRGGYERRYVRRFREAMRASGLYWGVCRFCSYTISAVLYRAAIEERIPALFTSYNGYEGQLHMRRAFKMAWMKRAALRGGPMRWLRILGYLSAAETDLLRLKLEFYVPPVSNLVARTPKSPPMRHVTLSRFIPWDVDAMAAELERATGWTAPHPACPMRFDCVLEDSLVNQTYRTASGMTVQGIICNNLIHCGLRGKDELREVIEHYEAAIPEMLEELERRLGA